MAKKATRALATRRAAALDRIQEEPGLLGTFQRMARDPKLTVDKLEKLIDLNERILDRQATDAFETAYELMLPEIPRITKRGQIKNKEKAIQSRYAKYEDIRTITDPILRRFGFTVHYSTRWPAPGLLQVVGELRHKGGGRRVSEFQTTADASGGKNAIQGLGSGVSYGKRYVLKDLLGIVEEGVDDDGQAHGKVERRPEPDERAEGLPPVHHSASGAKITDKQRKRLWTLWKNSGRMPDGVLRDYLARLGFESSSDITQDRYDAICKAIEAPGELR